MSCHVHQNKIASYTHLATHAQLRQVSARARKPHRQRSSECTHAHYIARPIAVAPTYNQLQPSQASSALQCARQAQVSHVAVRRITSSPARATEQQEAAASSWPSCLNTVPFGGVPARWTQLSDSHASVRYLIRSLSCVWHESSWLHGPTCVGRGFYTLGSYM